MFHRTHKVKVRIEKSGRKGRKKNFSIGQEICACSASEEVVLHETSHAEISANKKASRKQERGEGKDDGYNIKTINSLDNKKYIKSTSDYDISKIGGSVNIIGTKTCPSCGGTDHQRSSSKLCMAKKKTSPPPKENIPQQKKKRGSGSKERRSRENFSDGISRPHYINVGGADETFDPVVDVSDPSFIPRATKFKLTFEAEYGGKEAREPTPKHLMSTLLMSLYKQATSIAFEGRKFFQTYGYGVENFLLQSPIPTSTTLLLSFTIWEYVNSQAREITGQPTSTCHLMPSQPSLE